MEEETKLIPEIIEVIINGDGKTARPIFCIDVERKYKIQEIMLGAGDHRKALPWTDKFLKVNTECMAEILENGKLRIIQSRF